MSFHARALTARHLRDIKWMREAEIKHGRVAMLATIGYTYPEAPWAVQAFPGEAYSHANPIKAAIAVPPGAWANIIVFVGLMVRRPVVAAPRPRESQRLDRAGPRNRTGNTHNPASM